MRKSQAQFREKLRKLRLWQNNDFLIKKRVSLQYSQGLNKVETYSIAGQNEANLFLGNDLRQNSFDIENKTNRGTSTP